MILIGYDGSPDARAAIARGAELLAGAQATVLTVWQPFVEVLTHGATGIGLAPGMVEIEEIDTAARSSAQACADEGVELARAAGLDARPRLCSEPVSTATAILNEADAVDASVILLGSRGLTGLKSLLLGSVSHAVIAHSNRPVIVVPSTDVADARRHRRADADAVTR